MGAVADHIAATDNVLDAKTIDLPEPISEFGKYYPRMDTARRCRVDTLTLLNLSSVNGKGMLLNCWCVEPHCIMRTPKGYTVDHEGPLTLWKIDVLRGRYIYVFDRAALHREILRGVGAPIRARDSTPGKMVIPHHTCLEEKLADARRNAPADLDDPE